MITIDDVLNARRWSDLGFDHNKVGFRQAQRMFHPDLNKDPRSNEAFMALPALFEAPDYSTRLAKGRRFEGHVIEWTLDPENRDLVDDAVSALGAIGKSIWVPEIREHRKAALSAFYGPGWWFLSEFPKLDMRTSVWVFRRLLAVVSVSAKAGVYHPSIDASHIVINPEDHGLMLDGWWGAGKLGTKLKVRPDGWAPTRFLNGEDPTPEMGTAQAAHLMLDISDVSGPIKEFFQFQATHPASPLDAFDGFEVPVHLTYGEKKFHVLERPATNMI